MADDHSGLDVLCRQSAFAGERARTSAAFARLLSEATVQWPQWIDASAYATHIGELAGSQEDPIAALESMACETYLTGAVLAGAEPACAALEARVSRLSHTICRRLGSDDAGADETASLVLEKLVVGRGDRGPRIGDYTGKGSLDGWLRATISREHLNRQRKHKREVLVGDEVVLEALQQDHDDPVLAQLKSQYRDQFKRAFERAIAQLSSRERGVLRYRFVDGATIDTIAAVYGVHRATCHRWLSQARATLARHTEMNLAEQLDNSDVDIESIRALIESQLDLSLSRMFGA